MRNYFEIDIWMRRNSLSVTKIKKALGYATHTGVSNTLAGRAHLRRVLQYLVDKGCPVKYLDLPEDMMNKEAA